MDNITEAIERLSSLEEKNGIPITINEVMRAYAGHPCTAGEFRDELMTLLKAATVMMDSSTWGDGYLAMEGLVRLPKDMDGEAIHIDDEMVSTASGKVFVVKRLKYSEQHGWMIGGACSDDLSEYNLYLPGVCRHHHVPTVEELLRQFADVGIRIGAKHGIKAGEFSFYADEDAVAEYAQKIKEVMA